MDPWLEAPHLWSGFHFKLINETVAVMQPQLRARGYYIDSGERVWLAEPARPVFPDDVVFAHRRRRPSDGPPVAVLEPDEPVRVKRADVEIREPYLEIFDAVGHRLVTGIEFVSPANKSDKQGRELYQRKQQELREAGVHLVEVDLIRRGPHVLDVPLELLDSLRPWDYLVNLVRCESEDYEVYPIRIPDRLPRTRLPLKPGDEDAVLDLQEVFDRAYQIGPYPERIDYSSDPSPPLPESTVAWADQLLKEKGFRR
jgi:hypothetical protein